MSAETTVRNDFLPRLLALQQDGRGAISAPNNWKDPPLLEVETETDKIVDTLQRGMLVGVSQNRTACWHFFVGSPGNGKSTATGRLCRKLITDGNCQIYDSEGTEIEKLEKEAIPYVLYVHESGNKHPSALIVQDASVVRKPFARDADPADDLIDMLRLAWTKGISLVVCTNRGVLEKAHAKASTRPRSGPWRKILKAVANEKTETLDEKGLSFDGKKPVFLNVKVSQLPLDNLSLLRGTGKIFHELVDLATREEQWKNCRQCPALGTCPFKSNRDWLRSDTTRIHKLLANAELLSGQIIVFREMHALLSLILAGCPKDYGQKHPCEWVQEKMATHDIFSLLTRRIYMCLYSSFSPLGLEEVKKIRTRQVDGIKHLSRTLPKSSKTWQSAKHIFSGTHPTTDVGVPRLIGRNGCITKLDPCLEGLPGEFYEQWSAYNLQMPTGGDTKFTDLEDSCARTWRTLEDCVEEAPDPSRAHAALRRWSSNFTLHFGVLHQGLTAWDSSLSECKSLADILSSQDERSREDNKFANRARKQISEVLSLISKGAENDSVRLSKNVTLSGRWVTHNLKPRVVPGTRSGNNSLTIEYRLREDTLEQIVLPAHMYLWLKLLASGRLDSRCFPREMLVGALDARVRAASKCGYAFEREDIEIRIKGEGAKFFKLTSFEDDIDVEELDEREEND